MRANTLAQQGSKVQNKYTEINCISNTPAMNNQRPN